MTAPPISCVYNICLSLCTGICTTFKASHNTVVPPSSLLIIQWCHLQAFSLYSGATFKASLYSGTTFMPSQYTMAPAGLCIVEVEVYERRTFVSFCPIDGQVVICCRTYTAVVVVSADRLHEKVCVLATHQHRCGQQTGCRGCRGRRPTV